MRIAVYGHVVLDYIISVPKIPEAGITVPVERLEVFHGGTAGNVAVAAARLGVPTALASFVARDFPGEYRRALEAAGVDLEDLVTVDGYATPRAWIFTAPDGQQVTVIDQGPMRAMGGFETRGHAVEASDLVHIGTGQPAYYERIASLARDRGRRVAFDPAQEIHYVYNARTFRRLLRMAHIFFANEPEMARGLKLAGLQNPGDLLSTVEIVVLTRGTRGSLILGEEGEIKVPCIRAKTVDATGAGDAYRAGFYAGLHLGKELRMCGLMGAAVASFAVEARGPQTNLPTWEQAWARVQAFLD
jgi:sugar/nucleoside kinase (ribokinase family)